MNTIFKFYYQAWVLMALAAAFSIYYVLGRGHARLPHWVWGVGCTALIVACLLYPALAIPNKTGGFAGPATLDGMAWLQQSRPDEYGAVLWLEQNVPDVRYIVEATGGSFSEYAFVSSFTGLPTMLGWGGHELQWRGNYDEPGRREPAIQQIYTSTDPQQVLAVLEQYDIQYVYVGANERRKYNLPPNVIDRLARFLEPVYQQGDVAILRRRP